MIAAATAATPKVKLSKLSYVDTFIIDCRLRGMYKQLLRKDYAKLMNTMNDTLDLLRTAPEIDMTRDEYNMVVDNIQHMRIEFAMQDDAAIHKRIRNMHYTIMNEYM